MVIAGAPPWLQVGWVIALIMLILCVVFAAIGSLPIMLALLIGGVALSRLL